MDLAADDRQPHRVAVTERGPGRRWWEYVGTDVLIDYGAGMMDRCRSKMIMT
jgi:hypothetical protein